MFFVFIHLQFKYIIHHVQSVATICQTHHRYLTYELLVVLQPFRAALQLAK